jgi:FAD:protein FMN transferase
VPDTIHTFRHEAMATYFEVRIAGAEAAYAGQAAQAAFSAVDRTEALLSRFLETSEVSQINRLQPGEVVRVSPDVFDCIEQALELQKLTRGAFDPTFAMRKSARRSPTGEGGPPRGQLLMDRESLLVGLEGGGLSLDLGAIGKGYALDIAAGELRAWDVERALLIGGGSSLLALAGPGADRGWEIALGGVSPARRLSLENNALGSSGTAVKGEHIIDPRTGAPVPAGNRTWAVAASAAAADALSTAWMVLSAAEIEEICAANPGVGAIVQTPGEELFCKNIKLET